MNVFVLMSFSATRSRSPSAVNRTPFRPYARTRAECFKPSSGVIFCTMLHQTPEAYPKVIRSESQLIDQYPLNIQPTVSEPNPIPLNKYGLTYKHDYGFRHRFEPSDHALERHIFESSGLRKEGVRPYPVRNEPNTPSTHSKESTTTLNHSAISSDHLTDTLSRIQNWNLEKIHKVKAYVDHDGPTPPQWPGASDPNAVSPAHLAQSAPPPPPPPPLQLPVPLTPVHQRSHPAPVNPARVNPAVAALSEEAKRGYDVAAAERGRGMILLNPGLQRRGYGYLQGGGLSTAASTAVSVMDAGASGQGVGDSSQSAL